MTIKVQIGVKFDEKSFKISFEKQVTFRKFEWSAWKLLDCRIFTQNTPGLLGALSGQTPAVMTLSFARCATRDDNPPPPSKLNYFGGEFNSIAWQWRARTLWQVVMSWNIRQDSITCTKSRARKEPWYPLLNGKKQQDGTLLWIGLRKPRQNTRDLYATISSMYFQIFR